MNKRTAWDDHWKSRWVSWGKEGNSLFPNKARKDRTIKERELKEDFKSISSAKSYWTISPKIINKRPCAQTQINFPPIRQIRWNTRVNQTLISFWSWKSQILNYTRLCLLSNSKGSVIKERKGAFYFMRPLTLSRWTSDVFWKIHKLIVKHASCEKLQRRIKLRAQAKASPNINSSLCSLKASSHWNAWVWSSRNTGWRHLKAIKRSQTAAVVSWRPTGPYG